MKTDEYGFRFFVCAFAAVVLASALPAAGTAPLALVACVVGILWEEDHLEIGAWRAK